MENKKKHKAGKWVLRIFTILLLVILSLCSALSYGIWQSSEAGIDDTGGGQKSLAWLKESEFLPNSKAETQIYSYDILKKAYTAADASSHVDSTDVRYQCMAYAGVNTVVSDEYGIAASASADKPYKDAVITGTCTAIEFRSISQKIDSQGVDIPCFGYVATIKIDKELSPVLDPDYPYSYIKVRSSQVAKDFSSFFIIGSRYMLNGTVSYLNSSFEESQAPNFTLAEADFEIAVTEVKFDESMYEIIGVSEDTKIKNTEGRSRKLTSCYLSAYPDESYLSYAKIQGSLEEFLSSDAGTVWKSTIKRKEVMKESVKIVTTNDIGSIPLFSSGMAYISEGTSFKQDEYLSGKKLCVISGQLAKSNNIKIGDNIDLKFWSNGYDLELVNSGTVWCCGSYLSSSAFLDEGVYSVVGIYMNDGAWDMEGYGFTPNTVFIPESSVNDAVRVASFLSDTDEDEYIGIPDSRTYILKMGEASAFNVDMETAGYGGMFFYYESGDPSFPLLFSLSGRYRLLTYISSAALVMAVVSMIVFVLIRNRRSTDKKIRLHAVLSVMIISAVSILISAVISISFFSKVTDMAGENSVISGEDGPELKTDPYLPDAEEETESGSIELSGDPSMLLMIFSMQTGALLLILLASSAVCFVIKGGEKTVPKKIKAEKQMKGNGIKGGMPSVIWYSIRQSARSPVTGVLMIVLVSLSSVFMFLSVSTWLTAKKNISNAGEAYTTIAVAAENEFLKDVDAYKAGIYDYTALVGMYEAAGKSEYVEYADIREKCMAYGSGIKTVTSGMSGEFTPISAVDYPYDLSLVVGKCISVKYEVGRSVYDPEIGGSRFTIACNVKLELDFNESPLLDDDYTYSRYITVYTYQIMNDLSECFQVGERYILYGTKGYSQYPKTEMYRDKPVSFHLETILPMATGSIDALINDPDHDIVKFEPYMHAILGTDSGTIVVRNSAIKEEYNIEDCYLLAYKDDAYMSYAKLDGTVSEFLSSEKGQKWQRWIEECGITLSSLKMNFTGNLDSVLLFNQGLAYITDGRTFTEEEYVKGAKVCVISAETAANSGIRVGDRIDFSFWSNGYLLWQDGNNHIWRMEPYGDGCGFLENGTFEVIGIYKAENVWEESEFFFTPNTAFAPAGSVKSDMEVELPTFNVWQYNEEDGTYDAPLTGQYISTLNSHSFVIKPGYVDDFEAEMEAYGYGGMFHYYDQGYSMIAPVLGSLKESAELLMYVSVAVWVVIIAAFCAIIQSKNMKSAGVMMSLGIKRRQIFIDILVSIMCVVIISSLAGGTAGYFMYDDIVGRIYEEAKTENANLDFSSYKTDVTVSGSYDSSIIEDFDLKRSPDTVILIGGIQLIVLSAAAVIMARGYSKMEPLVLIKGLRRQKGKKR
jgi:hypothetical protein